MDFARGLLSDSLLGRAHLLRAQTQTQTQTSSHPTTVLLNLCARRNRRRRKRIHATPLPPLACRHRRSVTDQTHCYGHWSAPGAPFTTRAQLDEAHLVRCKSFTFGSAPIRFTPPCDTSLDSRACARARTSERPGARLWRHLRGRRHASLRCEAAVIYARA